MATYASPVTRLEKGTDRAEVLAAVREPGVRAAVPRRAGHRHAGRTRPPGADRRPPGQRQAAEAPGDGRRVRHPGRAGRHDGADAPRRDGAGHPHGRPRRDHGHGLHPRGLHPG